MRSRIITLLLLLASLNASGCLAIEKKSQVLVIPPDSKEVHMYCVFEGISVREPKNKDSLLGSAKGELDDMKKPGFHFFSSAPDEKSPLLPYCRFEETRFFVNPERKRQLCMDRRVTIIDREAFAKALNKSMSKGIASVFEKADSRKILAEIKELSEKGEQVGLVKLASELDLASIQRIKTSAENEFRWVRFEPWKVRIIIPATPDCARRIIADPKTKDRLKELRRDAGPLELLATDEGLEIVLGKEGQVIRLTSASTEPYRASDEKALIEHAGSPKAILIDGKTANADMLIERFIAEKTKKR